MSSLLSGMGFQKPFAPPTTVRSRLRSRPTGPESSPRESLFSQAHLLVGRREVQKGGQPDCGLIEPRADPVKRGWLEDRSVHDALVHQLLDLAEQRLAPLPIALTRLLQEQIVDVRITAV